MADTENKGGGYEERDVSLRALWRPALGLVLMAVLSFVVVDWLLAGLQLWREPAPVDPSRAALERSQVVPPEPHLQTRPEVDLEKVRAEAEETLHSYGWVNQAEGKVRIPIDRAMALVAERGLPHRDGREVKAKAAGEEGS